MSLSQRKGSSEMQMAQTPNTMDIERNLLDLAIRRSTGGSDWVKWSKAR